MTNAVIECILSRCATKYFDSSVTLSDDQIRELVRIATSAPTSFHLQNWRFIAVRTPEAKARLSPIAWNQPPITDAAVTFIVCGQLADSSVIPERLAPMVEAASCRQRWCSIGKSPHAVCISSTRRASATGQYAPAQLARRL